MIPFINSILLYLFGRRDGLGVFIAWQSMSVGFPWQGRAWLHWRHDTYGFEWTLGRMFLHAGLELDAHYDHNATLEIAIPPIAIWFWTEAAWCRSLATWLIGRDMDRAFRLAVHDMSIWWSLWASLDDYRDDWRSGSLSLSRLLVGRETLRKSDAIMHDVLIPMPEGAYPATVLLYTAEHGNRWRTRKIQRAEIDVPCGIPFDGKGESDYDMGEDGTWSLTTCASTVDEAIDAMVKHCLDMRAKRDGDAMAHYPAAAERVARFQQEAQ